METLWQDLRYGFRMLRRRPMFAVLSILTLTLGIGVNTAIFSILYTTVLQPLPYPDPDSLGLVYSYQSEGRPSAVSPIDFQDFIDMSGVFQSAAMLSRETYNITGNGEPERIWGADVSARFFDVFGVKPVIGRKFRLDEEKPGTPRVVVLSYGLWQRRFNGSGNALGQSMHIDGNSYTVIGIAPRNFHFPSDAEIWRPLRLTADDLNPKQRGARYLMGFGRIKRGIAFDQARARIEQIGRDLARMYPNSDGDISASMMRLQDFSVRRVRKSLLVLFAAVAFVLLIACANVANLFLVHASQREAEVSVRAALGAGRARLIRQFLIESVLLTGVAGGLGVIASLWLTQLIKSFGPADIPRLGEIGISVPVLLFTLGISVVAGVFVGIIPALRSASYWGRSLNSAGHRFTLTSRTRAILVTGEIALALMLLAGAGLLIRSFARLQQVDPGFHSAGVYTFGLSLPDVRYPELHDSSLFYSELTHKLAQQPGVESAGAIFGLPLTKDYSAGGTFERSDRPGQSESDEPRAALRVITPDYFQVMGIAVRSGRSFHDADDADAPGVAIVNEAAARRYWPGENPIGKQLRPHISLIEQKSKPRTIVGIVGDVHFDALEENPEPEIYIPHAQHPVELMMVVLRAKSGLTGVGSTIRAQVKSMDPELPIWDLRSMDEIVGASLAQRRFTMYLLASFAGLAVVLAAVGIYGVLSYTVVQRTREIGLRMAVGARASDVLRLFVKEGMQVLVIGVIAGLAGGLAVARVLESLLFRVPSKDPMTFAAVVFLLCIVAMTAGVIPAIRASRVDPMSALRYE